MPLLYTCFALALLNIGLLHATTEPFAYKRNILTNIDKGFYSLPLPDDIFSHIRKHCSDIRIIGIDNNGDSVEAPFFVQILSPSKKEVAVPCAILNRTNRDRHYYITAEIAKEQRITTLQLEVQNHNFAWLCDVEGSNNQEEWFLISKQNRLMGIANGVVRHSFTDIYFPPSQFRFYRLRISGDTAPNISNILCFREKKNSGVYSRYVPRNISKSFSQDKKTTTVDVRLAHAVPVSSVSLHIPFDGDYRRIFRISYIADSTKTPKGWLYDYQTLAEQEVVSEKTPQFYFANTICKSLRITIENGNNEPLEISEIDLRGNPYRLVARFSKPARYALYYGNAQAQAPQYDLAYFAEKISDSLPALLLGGEERVAVLSAVPEPWIENSLWIWATLAIVIAGGGWFAISLLRSGENMSENTE